MSFLQYFNENVVKYFRDEKALCVDLCVLVTEPKTSEAQMQKSGFHRFCVLISGVGFFLFEVFCVGFLWLFFFPLK